MLKLVGVTAILLLVLPPSARAECICQCVNGQMRPLCDNSMDMRPICPMTICPMASPSITPIQPPMIPPIGTSNCRQARICDAFGNCRWQTVCN